MLTWTSRLCGAAALLAASLPVQAQVVSPSPGAAPDPASRQAQPTPPAFTSVTPGSDAAETFECRSLLTLLRVDIPSWERATAWFLEPFVRDQPTLEQLAARQRCFDVMASPVVTFQENVPVERPVDRVPRPGM
ncbi:hypothetical protein JL100_025425 [Skermanella mucosa]|uniref:hypothetical protein n=1 Tax=Skermanella mucosa TaxID=1789672 RepID=UPI00192C172C|nr:hypothetical protein [Skermanella mucosa]UEM20383.1 hypothetical protein JL100_025425 [Skermanella mucosa]